MIFLLLFGLIQPALATLSPDYDSAAHAARETLAKLVAADTTNPPGNEARAVEIAAATLDEAGIPYEVTEFAPGRKNIVARLKATGNPEGKPILLLAHTDVVTAAGQPWATDPHQMVEKGVYLLGRGVSDDLGMATVNLEVFLLLKKSGTPLRRDVILALEGDEESDGSGIRYLVKHKPESVDAAVCFNEGGGFTLDAQGKVKFLAYSAAEKIYQDFELVTHAPPGHSSVPLKDNSIYRLAHALTALEAHPDSPHLIPVTRAYFAERAKLEKPPLADAMRELAQSKGSRLPARALKVIEADPQLSANLRTTCVATTLAGGTRVNALPAQAVANVNCRILPGETVEQTQTRLTQIVHDPQVEIRIPKSSGQSGPSPLDGEGPRAVERITHAMWPGLPIIPSMMRGASDSRFLRPTGVACYGLNPMPSYESDALHVHGVDERIPVASLRTGVEFLHRLVLELAGR
jgi:acetylornithine deacetylase/succinyl-diaminopimelate desuccinylase-like protein